MRGETTIERHKIFYYMLSQALDKSLAERATAASIAVKINELLKLRQDYYKKGE